MLETVSLEKEPSLFSICEQSVMEKGTWTLIIPLAPATSQRGYRWLAGFGKRCGNAYEMLGKKRRLRA
jgi:hypothetical protein